MAKEFLSEAFRKLNILGEDIFNMDDDGIKDLKEFEKNSDNAVDTEVTVIDTEADSVEDLKDTYVGQVILQCPVCHSFIFKDRTKIVVNKVSDLVNVDEECPYCCTVSGFTVIGQVTEFNATEDEEDTVDEAEVEETTDTVETEVKADGDVVETETTETEEVEESLDNVRCDDEGCETEEGLLGTIARGITPLPIVGKILGDGLEAASTDEDKDTVCEVCGKNPCECYKKELTEETDECKDGDCTECKESCEDGKCEDGKCEDEKDEGLFTTGLTGLKTLKNVVGGILGDDLDKKDDCENCDNTITEEKVVVSNEETKTDVAKTYEDAINDALTVDGWTSFEYDDEDDTVPVEIYNGEKVAYTCFIKDGVVIDLKEVAEEVEDKEETNDDVTTSEDDTAATETTDTEEVTETVNEDLTVTTEDDGTVTVDSSEEGKTVTVADLHEVDDTAEVVDEPVAEETVEEVKEDGEEEMKDETIVPLTDEEKIEIEQGTDTETVEDTTEEATENTEAESEVTKETTEDEEEADVDVDEIEEESFDRLSEKFLTNTYENVESYRTVRAQAEDNVLKLEGIIKFKSGKEKPTSYILEAKDITPSGKARFVGENKQISSAKKAFTVSGKLSEGKFIVESFNYNYNTKDAEGKSTKVYGTVSNRK